MRALRRSKGLKLKEVAEAVGLSAGFISQLEAGKTGASFSTLMTLCHFYGCNLSDVLRVIEAPSDPFLSGPRQRVSIIRGEQFDLEWLMAGPDHRMEVSIMTIQPDGDCGEPYVHEGEEFCLILDGNVRVSVQDEAYELASGDLLYFGSQQHHSWHNTGDGPARILWCTTPPRV